MNGKPKCKRCPHCGGLAVLNGNYNDNRDAWFVFVKCRVCGATGKTCITPNDPDEVQWKDSACLFAIDAWNLRYTEPEPEQERYFLDDYEA